MVKGISSINGIVKTGIIATMLAGSSALYASNPIREVNNELNQTEVVSKAGADAVKALSVQNITQSSIPITHNKKLDAMLRKFIEDENDRKYINNVIHNIYKKNGIYLGSALMQHLIDFHQFFAFLSQNTDIQIKNNINPALGKQIKNFGPKFFETLEPYANTILNWADQIHNEELFEKLKFDHNPSFKEVEKKVNSIVNESVLLTTEEQYAYYNECIDYLYKKERATDAESASDMLARQMYIMDKAMYNKILKKLQVFTNDQFKNGNTTMQDYFNMWMDSVKPDKKY